MHSKTKHIPIKYHYLREQICQKDAKLEYIDIKEDIADIFSKPLPKEAFEHPRQKNGSNIVTKVLRGESSILGGEMLIGGAVKHKGSFVIVVKGEE